ncbi:MAG: hypothetical protein KME49_29510 [Brasilonema octagenarum HA4186-MV1]|jgi:hypothetical protein|uniref:Uncharacterized protein n=2 Tax=Brasilonema TaxID=383614 RepID=A0A856MB33_9CYAN|nr:MULTISPECIES: hypothetical protein [Brasilonema]MBW4597382.1 hypothetical protein [Brasilonema angustatum HA4187-MV1]MBW4629540.1 hypothetical protein [Brasilonema octagenarum HA4186-MV1]QDL14718.1 hypothetical protein DP113_10975 [Brasilonema octagenarum UFV-E1]NMF63365.1 hypothetical protein [Brasilonema octagenarum UFV-OR1]QDL08363.1 hypothetical protein DP114_11035 [Brasilonema sennae CENA114]
MLEIGWFSARLFFKGKLLRDPMNFVKQTAIGISISASLLFLLAQTQVSLWIPVTVSSFLTGILMPFLHKELKMK